MPTGYTACLLEDKPIEFKDFALNCARAFVALIELRDDNGPIPEKLPESNWHKEAHEEAVKHLENLKSLNGDDATALGQKKKEEAIESTIKRIETARRNREKLQAMLDKVSAWKPPTTDHINLKAFMSQQIKYTIDFDGRSIHEEGALETLGKKPDYDFFLEELNKAEHMVTYHAKEQLEEKARNTDRNDWLKQLRESLK